jgi:hypothetical protein
MRTLSPLLSVGVLLGLATTAETQFRLRIAPSSGRGVVV